MSHHSQDKSLNESFKDPPKRNSDSQYYNIIFEGNSDLKPEDQFNNINTRLQNLKSHFGIFSDRKNKSYGLRKSEEFKRSPKSLQDLKPSRSAKEPSSKNRYNRQENELEKKAAALLPNISPGQINSYKPRTVTNDEPVYLDDTKSTKSTKGSHSWKPFNK